MRINLALIAVLGLTLSSLNNTQAQTEITLYSFSGGADGYDQMGGLAFDSSGNLYGTNVFGEIARNSVES